MLKKLLAKSAIKVLGIQLLEMMLDSYVWPMAQAYVEKTPNSRDNKVLHNFKEFIGRVIEDFKAE